MRSGFSLVEVMVVLVMLSTALTVVVPAINKSIAPDPLNDAIDELWRTVRATRNEAMRTGTRKCLDIDPAIARYWLLNECDIVSSASFFRFRKNVEIVSSAPRLRLSFEAAGTMAGDSIVLAHGGERHALKVASWLGGQR